MGKGKEPKNRDVERSRGRDVEKPTSRVFSVVTFLRRHLNISTSRRHNACKRSDTFKTRHLSFSKSKTILVTFLFLIVAGLLAYAATLSFTFDTPSNFVYDSSKIIVTGGAAELRNDVIQTVDADDTQGEFEAGTLTGTSWQTNKVVIVDGPTLINTEGLIAYWSFDEAAGTDAADVYGGFDGTHQGTPGIVSGQSGFGNALDFDGGSDYVDTNFNPNFGATDDFSIALWYKSDDTTHSDWVHFFSSHADSGSEDEEIYVEIDGSADTCPDDTILFRVGDTDSSGSDDVCSTSKIDNTNWHHLAATYDVDGNMEIYVDGGSSEGTTAVTASSNGTKDFSSYDFFIGSRNEQGSPTGHFDGIIDDVMVFGRTLTAAEVNTLGTGTVPMGIAKHVAIDEIPGLSAGLVSYWDFENGTGTNASDQAGTNDGTLTLGPGWSDAVRAGLYGIQFDGNNDYVTMGTPASLNNLGPVTYAAWINPRTGGNAEGRILGKFNGANDRKGLQLQSSNRIEFRADASTPLQKVSANDAIKPDTWQHVALTWDGSVNHTGVRIYINGTETTYGTEVNASGGANDATWDFTVGRDPLASSSAFEGLMDEVGVWNRILSAEEVRRLYSTRGLAQSDTVDAVATSPTWAAVRTTMSKPYGRPLEKPPVAYWKFEEGSGTTLDNVEGTPGFDGTLTVGAGGTNTATADAWSNLIPNAVFANSYSLDFDGTDDYVDSNYNPNFGSSDDYSIALWFKSDDTSYTQDVVFFGAIADTAGDDERIELKIDGNESECATDRFMFLTRDTDGPSNEYICGTSTANDTNWHHLAATYDVDGDMELFLDGSSQGSLTVTSNSSGAKNFSSYEFYIGARNDRGSDNRYFDGLIDEVAVFDYALTSTQVVALASGERAPWIHPDAGMDYEKNLIGLWRLENDTNDSTGKHHGTWNDSNTSGFKVVDGVHGAAVDFDGTDDYVEIPHDDDFNTGSITLAAWFRTAITGDYGLILNRENSTSKRQFQFRVDSDGLGNFIPFFSGSAEHYYTSSTVNDNQWHHLAATYDETSGDINMYVDGILETATSRASAALDSESDLVLRIGYHDLSAGYFDGEIDEAMMFDTALTAAQVTDLFERGASRLKLQARTGTADPPSSEWSGSGISEESPGLVSLWQLNGGTSGAIADSETVGFEDALGNNDGAASNGGSGMAWAQGMMFGAVDFDGTDDYVDTNYSPNFAATDDFSISLWFQSDDASYTSDIVFFGSFGDSGAEDERIELKVDGDESTCTTDKFFFIVSDTDSSGTDYVCGTSAASDTKWHHLVTTYDVDGNMELFLDGLSQGATAVTANSNGVKDFSSYDFYVGARNFQGADQRHFDGKIDDVAVWNRSLSGEEVYNLYQNGLGRIAMDSQHFYGIEEVRYMQYRGVFESLFDHAAPDVQSVTIRADGFYPTDNPTIEMATGQAFSHLTAFTETANKPAGSDIKYIISPDDGTTWYYNPTGSAWVTSNETYAQTSTVAQINGDMAELDNDASMTAAGTYKFRAYLNSDGYSNPQLQTLDTDYENGSITVVAPNSGENWEGGTVQYVTWTPSGTIPDDLALEYDTAGAGSVYGSPGNIAASEGNHHNEEDMAGIVAAWHFSEDSGTTLDNAEGTAAKDGTLTVGGGGDNTTVADAWIAGQFGPGLDFDGTDDRVEVLDHSDFTFNTAGQDDPFSISIWVNMDDATNFTPIAKLDNGANFEWYLYVSNLEDKVSFALGDSGATNYIQRYYDTALTGDENSWIHLAATYDGSESSAGIRIYRNGTRIDDSTDNSGSYTGMSDTASLVRLGVYDGFGYSNGSIDEVAIFDHVLSAAELAFLSSANAGYPWTVANDPSPTARVRVRSASAPAIRDASNADFTIAAARTITMTAPNGNEVWTSGSSHLITWNSTGSPLTDVALEYSTNGSDWVVIGDTVATPLHSVNDTPYTWQLPEVDSQTVTVRARSIGTPSITDESDGNFTIQDTEHTVHFTSTYNSGTTTLEVTMWISKSSIVQTDGALLGAGSAQLFDAGTSITTLNDPAADANGFYNMSFDNSSNDLVVGKTYDVTASITFNGVARSTDHSFSITVVGQLATANTAIAAVQSDVTTALSNQSNIETKIDTIDTNVDTLVTDSSAIKTATGVGQAQTLYDQATTTVTRIGDEADLSTDPSVFGRIKDVRENMAGGGNANVASHKILNRNSFVKTGETVKIQFKAPTGLNPTLDVFDATSTQRVTAGAMTELGGTGIYEYSLTLNAGWGLGDFLVIAAVGGNTDSLTLSVLSTDLDTIDANVDQVLTDTTQIKQDTGDQIAERATVNDGSPTITGFVTTLSSTDDDFYNDMIVIFTDGPADGQMGRISDYDQASKAVTFDPALVVAPANGNAFTVLAQSAVVGSGGLTASDVWTYAGGDRTLSGDGLAGPGALATQAMTDAIKTETAAILADTDVIDWTDVTDILADTGAINWTNVTDILADTANIDTNVATLITEIGSGVISGIETETNKIQSVLDDTAAIDWTDIDAIKANTDDLIAERSTINDGSPTVNGFATNLSNGNDDFYNDMILVITDGPADGQVARISDYVGGTKTLSFSPPLNAAPANGNAFTVLAATAIVGTGGVTASDVWSYSTRELTGDGLAGGGALATAANVSAVETKVDTIDTVVDGIAIDTGAINWTDVTDILADTGAINWTNVTDILADTANIDTNVATLITEIGTGVISGIETETNKIQSILDDTATIDWTDVDAIVTNTSDTIVERGTVSNVTSSSIFQASDVSSSTDDFYNDLILVFTSGANDGQVRRVEDYVGGTKEFTVDPALSFAPSNGHTFTVLAQSAVVGSNGITASQVWGYSTRELTGDGLSGAEGIATASALSTVDGKLDTIDTVVDGIAIDTGAINWTDVTDILADTGAINWTNVTDILADSSNIDTNVATLITEIGSGVISGIETEVNKIQDILDDTATIDWTDITAIKQNTDDSVADRGTISNVTSTSLFQASDLASGVDNFYNDMIMVMTSGPNDGQVRRVVSYTGSTKELTISPGLTTLPVNGQTFTVLAQSAVVGSGGTSAADMWAYTGGGGRTLTGAGLSSGSLATKADTDAIKTDTGNLLSDTGTLKTDTSNLLTDTGAIRAQTDTKIQSILDDTDTIDWTNVTDILTVTNNLDSDLVAARGSAVTDVGNTTTSFETNLAQTNNDYYKDQIMIFTAGSNAGQVRRITGYNGTTKFLSLGDPVQNIPDNAHSFTILAQIGGDTASGGGGLTASDVWNYVGGRRLSDGLLTDTGEYLSTNAIHAQVDDSGYVPTQIDFETTLTQTVDDFFEDQLILFTTGQNTGAVRRIVDYNGTNKRITVHENFPYAPADGDEFNVLPTAGGNTGGGGDPGITAQDIWTYSGGDRTLSGDGLDGAGALATAANVSNAQSAIQTDISNLDGKIDIIDTNVDDIETDTSAMQPQVNTMNTKVATIETQVGTGLISNINTEANKIQTILDDTADMQPKVDTINTKVGNIETELGTGLVSNINTQANKIQSILDDTATIDWTDIDTIRQNTNDMIAERGAINDGAPGAGSFVTNLPSSIDDFYNDMILVMTTGSAQGQVRRVADYVQGTKTLTLDPPLSVTPANADTFTVLAQSARVGSGALTASDVWGYTTRELTGDGLAGAGALSTQAMTDAIKTETAAILADTSAIDWTDVTDILADTAAIDWSNVTDILTDTANIDTNVSTLITEVGSGVISGLQTDTTAIRAQTDSKIQQILDDTATIDWTDVTAIKQNTDDMIVERGTVNDGTLPTTSMVTTLSSGTDDFYKDTIIVFTSGTNQGVVRHIDDYVGASKTIILDRALPNGAGNGDAFTVLSQSARVGNGSLTAADVWAFATRELTGDGLAGAGALSTQAMTDAIKTETAAILTDTTAIDWTDVTDILADTSTINWTNVTDILADTANIDTNVATLITEIGSGVISGLQTDTTAIRAQTDSKIQQILDDTDTIDWTDVDGIKQNTDDMVAQRGAINDLAPATSGFVTNLTSAVDDFYNDMILVMTSGPAQGQVRRVQDYNGTTKAVTLDPALSVTPANTNTFTILAQSARVGSGGLSALDVWSYTTRELTGDGLAGIEGVATASALAASDTKVDTIDGIVDDILLDTATIDWTNVTDILTDTAAIDWTNVTDILTDTADIQPNVATLITEIGSGVVSSIQTETNKIQSILDDTAAIDWTDIDTIRQNSNEMISTRGSINDTTPTTSSFITNLGSATDNYYNDMVVVITSGANTGSVRKISDYDGATRRVTLSAALLAAPANGDTFTILAMQGEASASLPDTNAISSAVWGATERRLTDKDLDSGELSTLAELKKTQDSIEAKIAEIEATAVEGGTGSGSGATQFAQSAAEESKKVYNEIMELKKMLGGSGAGGLAAQMEEISSGMKAIRSSIVFLTGSIDQDDQREVVTIQQVHTAIVDLINEVRNVGGQEGINLDAIYDDIAKQGQTQEEIQNMVTATEAVAASIQEMMEKAKDKPVMTTWFETATPGSSGA